MRLLFVCLGNICRSPTAEGVMRGLLAQAGLEGEVETDSAGTGAWHLGEEPDVRAVAAAARRGYALRGPGRQVTAADLRDFDRVLAMDRSNLRGLERLAAGIAGTGPTSITLLREHDPAARGRRLDVPDPYYGGADGFEEVLDLVEAACGGLLEAVRAELRGAARR